MIQLLYKTPHHMGGWVVIYAMSIPKAFIELQRTLDKAMRDNPHIAVYEIDEIKISYYRKDPRKLNNQ